MTSYDLQAAKRSRVVDVLTKTELIAAAGFTFAGVSVRVNTRALLFYQSLNDLGAALSTTTVPAADELNPPLTITLANIGAFTGAWKSWLRDLHANEQTILTALRSANDQAQLEAVQDNRVVP